MFTAKLKMKFCAQSNIKDGPDQSISLNSGVAFVHLSQQMHDYTWDTKPTH